MKCVTISHTAKQSYEHTYFLQLPRESQYGCHGQLLPRRDLLCGGKFHLLSNLRVSSLNGKTSGLKTSSGKTLDWPPWLACAAPRLNSRQLIYCVNFKLQEKQPRHSSKSRTFCEPLVWFYQKTGRPVRTCHLRFQHGAAVLRNKRMFVMGPKYPSDFARSGGMRFNLIRHSVFA